MRDLIPRKDFGTMMDSLFGDFWNQCNSFSTPSLFKSVSNNKFSYPKINIRDFEDKYMIEAGVPGLNKENVKVEYADGYLTISGENKNKDEVNRNGYVLRELHKSSFSRTISIDEDLCDVENISAGVDEGILSVEIPKKVLDKPPNKRIIQVE